MTDERLAELLRDAVAGVEPADRLADIRARTATPTRSARPWLYAAGATVLATAAAVTAFSVLGQDDTRDLGPAGHDEPTAPVSPTVTPSSHLVPAYFLGDTTRGPRLFREYDLRTGTADPLADALAELQDAPDDPDYWTPWPEGSLTGLTLRGDVYTVELGDASLHDRPAGMTAQEAEMAIQQVVYTVQAAVQDRAPVQFVLDGNPINEVYGVPTSEPLANAKETEVLNQVQVNDPVEGQQVSGTFTARGAADSFEANVPWQIKQGETVVLSGAAMADGWMGRLYPWEARIDVSGLEPGTYTFVAMTDDPSGGAEGAGPWSDTRTIVVG